MAVCPACQRLITDDVRSCPFCGSPYETDQDRTLRYWGLGLIWLGVFLELYWAQWPLTLLAGMVLSGVGIVYYALAKGHHPAWGFYAVFPVLGPWGAMDDIKTWPLQKKRRSLRVIVGTYIVIGFVAALVIPNFLILEEKATQAIPRIRLGVIFAEATKYRQKHGTFEIADIRDLNFEIPEGTKVYSVWYAVKGVPTAIPGSSRRTSPCDVTSPPTSVRVTASATGFTAAAKGNLDRDDTCDEWSINDAKEFVNTLNDSYK